MTVEIASLVSDNLDMWTTAVERRSSAGRGGGRRVNFYGIDRLRPLIVDLAVRGKLTSQEPSEEPAATALAKLVKARRIKIETGGVRKPKALSPLPPDLPPLPKGWSWTQLGTVAEISPSNNADDQVDASFVPMALVSTRINGDHQAETRKWGEIKKGFTHFAEGDIGLAKITPCFENGKAAIFENLANGIGAGTTELHVARPWSEDVNRRYLLLTTKTASYLHEGEAKMTGTAGQKRVTRAYFESTPLPLPPLAEQQRIVAKVDELMALCDALEADSIASMAGHQALVDALLATLTSSTDAADLAVNWARLEAHFDTLLTTEPSVNALKQTILTMALTGKFSANADWPGEPVALKSVARLQNGYAFKSEWFSSSGVRLLRNINVGHGNVSWGEVAYLPDNMASDYERFQLQKENVVLTLDRPFISTGTKVAKLAEGDVPALLLQRVGRFQISERIVSEFIYYWVCSPIFSSQVDPGRSNGVPYISSKEVEAAKIFVPSVLEQRRIVANVDELMALCDALKSRLTDAAATQRHLADSVVEAAAA